MKEKSKEAFSRAWKRLPASIDIRSLRPIRRILFLALACLSTAGILIIAFRPPYPIAPPPRPDRKYLEPLGAMYKDPSNPLTNLSSEYSHLRDDMFTIALHTHERPKELEATLEALTKTKIPSLLEIVVVWSNFDQDPPKSTVTKHGVTVRYRKPDHDSLNEKLRPDPDFKTQAILLSDDDVYYEADDLEFVFQSWRKFGQYRLVGALPRCSIYHSDKTWHYTFCKDEKEEEKHYSMILTNLCFTHIAFLGYYWSNNSDIIKIREYVDDHFNCEDIALNFLASNLTGWGPLEANGFKRYYNFEPAVGISRKPGHLKARSQCLNDFADIVGYMPLVDETSHIVRGMTVL